MKTILLTTKYDDEPYEIIQSFLPKGFRLIMIDEISQQNLEDKAALADYILASGRLIVNDAVLSKATKLQMIQRTGVGLNSLNLDAIKFRNIPVYVNQGVNADSVAEHTIMLILACLKRLPIVNNRTKSGTWEKQAQGVLNNELGTQTVGVIGMGNIGQKVAKLIKAFGSKVMYYDNYRKTEIEEILGIRFATLDELFASSDIITLHSSLTDENISLINKSTINKMKDGVVLINTARGSLVNEEDLIKALIEGKIAFAGLDVFQEEPTRNLELLSMDNVITTPHIAGITYDSFTKMMKNAMRNIELFDSGRLEDIKQHRLSL